MGIAVVKGMPRDRGTARTAAAAIMRVIPATVPPAAAAPDRLREWSDITRKYEDTARGSPLRFGA
ncbi:hypothetical protein MTP03_33480 [Tsukamurella sp. PLM1]|nr:hypothetical protein MTP03_33480 [Tsukamurella sp. PLM1]